MLENAPSNKVRLAIQKAVVATFNEEKWRELGFLLDDYETVSHHDRLLRSLRFGDDDYGSCAFQVVDSLLKRDTANRTRLIEEFVDLEAWLQANEPALHSALYGTLAPLDLKHIEDAASVLRADEFHRHVARIRGAIDRDPEQAIGSSKELLESVLKAILGEHGQKAKTDIPELLKRTQKQLSLDVDSVLKGAPGADTVRRTISNLGQLVVGVVEVRNLYGTGHGRAGSRELDAAHTRLVVNAAITLATYFLEVWRLQGQTPT